MGSSKAPPPYWPFLKAVLGKNLELPTHLPDEGQVMALINVMLNRHLSPAEKSLVQEKFFNSDKERKEVLKKALEKLGQGKVGRTLRTLVEPWLALNEELASLGLEQPARKLSSNPLELSIRDIGASTRLRNCLEAHLYTLRPEEYTLGAVIKVPKKDWLRVEGFGKGAMAELENILHNYSLNLPE